MKNALRGQRYSIEWVARCSLHLILRIIGVFILIFPIRKKMEEFIYEELINRLRG